MPILLPDPLPWFVAGPLIGLCVVALYALTNHRLGVTTSYFQVGLLLRRGFATEAWRVWFFAGLAAGSLMAALLRGGPTPSLGYGALALLVPVGLLIPLLFLAGLVMGFGARWAGGCTSGHGISGVSSLSPASIAATATFMATAIALTLGLHLLTGGAL
jgi:uncharacterized membrane protein YedE/YeeE